MKILTEDQVIEVAMYYVEYCSTFRETGRRFGVGKTVIARVINTDLPRIPGMRTLYNDAMKWKQYNCEQASSRGGIMTASMRCNPPRDVGVFRINPRMKYMKFRGTVLTVSPKLFNRLSCRMLFTKVYKLKNAKTGDIR